MLAKWNRLNKDRYFNLNHRYTGVYEQSNGVEENLVKRNDHCPSRRDGNSVIWISLFK